MSIARKIFNYPKFTWAGLLVAACTALLLSPRAFAGDTADMAGSIRPQLIASTAEWIDQQRSEGAPLSLTIVCQLRVLVSDCEDLRRNLFAQFPGLVRMDSPGAQLQITLLDEQAPLGRILRVRVHASSTFSTPQFDLPARLLPQHLDSSRILREITASLAQALTPFISLSATSGIEEIVRVNLTPNVTSTTKTTAATDAGRWFMEMGLSAFGSGSGIGSESGESTSSSVSAQAEVNRSTLRTRTILSVSAARQSRRFPGTDGKTVSGSSDRQATTFVGLLSLDPSARWNIAIEASRWGDVGSNVDGAYDAGAGLEYTLVPIRIDQPFEFRVRGRIAHSDDHLLAANDRGNIRERYEFLDARLFGFWLLLNDRLSISGSAGGRTNLTYGGYSSASASTNMTVQLNSALRFNTAGSYGYSSRNIRFAGVPDYSNPAQTQFLSGFAGGNYSMSMGLAITFGQGGLIRNRDRRWR